jgi:hypothetical protein
MPAAQPDTQRSGGGRERRQHPRVEAPWPIHLLLRDGPCEARLRDVSRSGVCFFLDRPIGLMTLLKLELDLPKGGNHKSHKVRGAGAVVRCERISPGVEHFEIAVFLHDLSATDRTAIDEYVQRVALSA